MDNFQIIDVDGQSHVVKECYRPGHYLDPDTREKIPVDQPNYRGTGMCLCGILKKGQTLDEFTRLYIEKKKHPKPAKV